MITSVKYEIDFQDSDHRRHSIPRSVIRSLVGAKEKNGLDGWPCLLEVYVVTCTNAKKNKPESVERLDPFIAHPNSGGEIRIGKRKLKGYPDELKNTQYLLVEITVL